MWVRSQDKTLLIKCDNFSIECYMKEKCFDIETIEISTKTHTTLGTYSTEEKALKVLDMIEETIDKQEEFKAQGEERPNNNSYSRLIKFVFQMPADEEIEE